MWDIETSDSSAGTAAAERALRKFGISFTRLDNGRLYATADIMLAGQGLTVLPDLSTVDLDGHFDCSNNRLTSLAGSPHSISGNFNCSSNRLASLKGAPKVVHNVFFCNGNPLTSLEGAPDDYMMIVSDIGNRRGYHVAQATPLKQNMKVMRPIAFKAKP